MTEDTIFALSSGALPSGVAVVRVSGPAALATLDALAGVRPAARMATLRTVRDGDLVIDRALVIDFPAPGSATGEDIAEFHLHGGRAVVAALLHALSRRPGLRAAQPGEFTRRAFDNDRLDLTQAEGLADLVAAETEAQRRAALAQSGGVLRRRVEAWREAILALRAEAEASLDFAEAEDDVAAGLGDGDSGGLAALIAELDEAVADSGRARALRDGLTVVVAGPPNVGKSSLVNALCRSEVAIVSPWPGTTRDPVAVRLDLGGVMVTLIDTAGLRDTDDPVEAEGIARARARAAAADLVLTLHVEREVPVAAGWPVRTKIDLPGAPPEGLAVSSLTGEGIATLTARLTVWAQATVRPEDPPLLASERHREACVAAVSALREASVAADAVLLAESLRRAGDELGAVIGVVGVEDVLNRIFSRFCIGK